LKDYGVIFQQKNQLVQLQVLARQLNTSDPLSVSRRNLLTDWGILGRQYPRKHKSKYCLVGIGVVLLHRKEQFHYRGEPAQCKLLGWERKVR